MILIVKYLVMNVLSCDSNIRLWLENYDWYYVLCIKRLGFLGTSFKMPKTSSTSATAWRLATWDKPLGDRDPKQWQWPLESHDT